MLLVNVQEILKGRFRGNVALPVFENAYQQDIIVIAGQNRFYIIEIPHINRYIVIFLVAIGIDETPLLDKSTQVTLPALRASTPVTAPIPLPTSSTFVFYPWKARPQYFPAAAKDDKTQASCAFPLFFLVFLRRIIFYNIQYFILYRSVTVEVFSGVKG